MEKLHEFSKHNIDKDCTDLSGHHENELFFNCKFNRLNGLTLKNCDLNRSEFKTASLRDALGITITLNCHSFKGVKLSELLFDLYLMMLHITVGNDEKREKLLDVIGRDRAELMKSLIRELE